MPPEPKNPLLSYLSLFTSLGTLLCCAVPSLLVLLGLGATVASVLSNLPWLVTLSHHKNWVFAIAGSLIAANLTLTYRRDRSCPPNAPQACTTASSFNRILLWVSTAIFLTGLFSAYLLGPLLLVLDN